MRFYVLLLLLHRCFQLVFFSLSKIVRKVEPRAVSNKQHSTLFGINILMATSTMAELHRLVYFT
jgi:hypothetical protein